LTKPKRSTYDLGANHAPINRNPYPLCLSRRVNRPSTTSHRRPRTQINRGGAPVGNENAKKSLPWLETYDLTTASGVDAFMQELVRQVWTGKLGTRAGSTINGTLRLLLEHMTLPQLEARIGVLERQVKQR
jgi:hypothetical protein